MKIAAEYPYGWIIYNNTLKRVFFSFKETRFSESANSQIETYVVSFKMIDPFQISASKADLILDKSCILFPNNPIIREMVDKNILK